MNNRARILPAVTMALVFLTNSLLSHANDSLASTAAKSKLNILIVTVDDMSCDSIGAFGCKLSETSPNIDALAKQGIRYKHAHVQVGNCMPSRNVLFSGLYPHNNGVEGFYQVRDAKHPHLVDVMQKAGYFVSIRGKATHSTPYYPYHWDADLSSLDGKKQDIKSSASYYATTKRGIEMATEANKPFCMSVNISDPHKPFYAMGKKGDIVPDKNLPTRVFTPEEVPIPGFLFDDPDVRLELAHYYSSVRRADDCFGAIMKALSESGQENNTIVFFLSDHGMPLPFAKTALYHHSTRTPWIVRWPSVTKPNAVDAEHMISAVDLMPTLIDIIGAEKLPKQDGRSFAPTLRGEKQEGRDAVFKVYNENAGGNRHPMRGIQTKRFGYLYNPWSDAKNVFATATRGTMTFRKMQELAPTNEKIAARLDLFEKRVVEEFYDYENDPDGLHNLIDDPTYADVIKEHRERLMSMMKETDDHATDVFAQRDDPAARAAYMERVNSESKTRKANKTKKIKSSKQNNKLFDVSAPGEFVRENGLPVAIKFKLPKKLGEQKFHATIKDSNGKRLERKVVTVQEKGEIEIKFDIPADYDQPTVTISVFVGEDYTHNLLHKTLQGIVVKKQ